VKHFANARFLQCYRALPVAIQALADRNYSLLRSNPSHGSPETNDRATLDTGGRIEA